MSARRACVFLNNKFFRKEASCVAIRCFHQTPPSFIVQAGKHSPTPKRDKPLTYDMSFPPHHIAHRKSWLCWNTSTLEGGLRKSQTVIEDMFVRKFISGTFPGYLLSEIIIKRQHNIIRISAVFSTKISARRASFLIGYTEEILSHWLRCIVKIEPVFEADPDKMIFKYI